MTSVQKSSHTGGVSDAGIASQEQQVFTSWQSRSSAHSPSGTPVSPVESSDAPSLPVESEEEPSEPEISVDVLSALVPAVSPSSSDAVELVADEPVEDPSAEVVSATVPELSAAVDVETSFVEV